MNFGEVANRLFGGSPGRGQSFLYAAEQRLVQRMARAEPRWITPAHLSMIGAVGAALAAAALVGCRSWPELVWLVPPAMFINWFGLTTDLPLARLRGGELPGAGMSHHVSELFSHILLIAAYGFSPFLTLRAAAAVLVCYLLFSSYGYIRAATRHVQQMAYIGLGVTEFRILLAFWPFAAIALGVPASQHDPLPAIDVAVIGLALVAVLGLFGKLFKDGRRIAAASASAAQSRDE
ncbi:hypothetical protein IYX23_14760 [Methylocystis sp. L43]|jgi:hypothetical protein|uniref:hypothetical protein n=1 Tax=unclassified Methylocystis TaxID=2625913 RepID=UPI0018C1ECD6|nr:MULTISPECIES: hypothetical protein [unclassified Methylocystis]MBG0798927.1 hypothetical protein [Methylocystis sp. L43]MBG0806697.1 hypothetical protein [Methylocystis sp. H15]